MHRLCMQCGKRKGVFSRNYAGFNVRAKAHHPYPERMEPSVLPGDKKGTFLCADCAGRHDIDCSEHGRLLDRIKNGRAPLCRRCEKESTIEKVDASLRRKLEALSKLQQHPEQPLGEVWNSYCARADEREGSQTTRLLRAKLLLWNACCFLCAAEGEKVARQFNRHILEEQIRSEVEPIWQPAAEEAIEIAKRAMSLSSDVGSVARAVLSRALSVKATTVDQAKKMPGYRVFEETIPVGIGIPIVICGRDLALMISQMKAKDLDGLVKGLPDCGIMTNHGGRSCIGE